MRSQVLLTSASRGLPVDLAVFDPVLLIMAAVALKVLLENILKILHSPQGEAAFFVNKTIRVDRFAFSSNLHTSWIQVRFTTLRSQMGG